MSRLKFVKRRLTLPHPTSTPVVLLIIACTRRAFASPITDPWALATGWQTSLALSQDWLAIEHYDRCVEMLVQPEDTPIGRVCMRSIGENWVVAVTTEAGWTASDTRVIIGRRGAKYAKYSGGATAETVSVPLFDLAGMLVDAMETSMGDGFIDVSIVARVFDGSIGAESPVPSHSSEGINDKDPHVAWAVDRSGNTTRPLRIVGRPVEMTEYNLAFQVWFPTPQVQWGTGKSRPTATTATGTAEATPISLQTPVSLSTAADHLTAVVSATFEVTPTISSTNTATVESPLAASKIDAIASLEPQPTTRPDYYYDDPNWVERDRLNAARAASVYSIIVEFGANEHGLKVHIAVD